MEWCLLLERSAEGIVVAALDIVGHVPDLADGSGRSQAAVVLDVLVHGAVLLVGLSERDLSLGLHLGHQQLLVALHLPTSPIAYLSLNSTSSDLSISSFLRLRQLTRSDRCTTISLIMLFLMRVPLIFMMLRSARLPMLVRKLTKFMKIFIL